MGGILQSAWLPLTPRGVASFVHAPTRRLLLVQFVFALMTAATIGWFLYRECFPTVTKAIEQLPAEGKIHSYGLDWRGESPQMLAEGGFLALAVDMNDTGRLKPTVDLQVEFGRKSFRFRSLLGIFEMPYPHGWTIAFSRTELKPIWGAWRPALLTGAIVGTVFGLMVCWCVLAAIYALVVLVVGFFSNRDLNFIRSWKLSGAALMPGAMIVTASILLFGFGLMDLVALLFFFGVHLIVGWCFLFLGLLFAPTVSGPGGPKKNPFANRSDR